MNAHSFVFPEATSWESQTEIEFVYFAYRVVDVANIAGIRVL